MAYEVAWRELVGSRPGPKLLVTGGVHGDEFEPMAAARRLLTEVSRESLRGSLVVAPVVNEPAFRRGMRTADDGLDLARTCPGRADGSITEQVAHSLAALIRSADFYIDLHTGGTRLKVLPLTGYMLHPDSAVLDAQRRMARAFGLPLIWGSDWRLEGRSLSVARDANVPAIYCEYHGGGECDPRGIDAYVAGCLNVMTALGMLEGTIPESPVGQVVAEDDRPGAGHMQVNLPAPREGFFEPVVALGDWVKREQRIGTVCDVLGEDRRPVAAPHDGLVIVIHSFRRVEAGESLGVILDAATVQEGLPKRGVQ